MKRPVVVIVLGVLALGSAVALTQVRCGATPDEQPPAAPTARQRPRTRALPGPAQPTPPPRGALSVRGRVLDPQGRHAVGAEVLATRDMPGESLSQLPCDETEPDEAVPLSNSACVGGPEELLLGLIDEGRGGAAVLARATTGADGTFSLEGLPEGTVELWATGAEGSVLKPGVAAGAEEVELVLQEARTLAGRVVDEAGAPLSGAQVTLFHEEHSRYFEMRTAADGRFTLGPLPEGVYGLVASMPGLLPEYLPAVIQEEVEEIVLHRPRRLSGQVLSQGQPAPGARVTVAYTAHVTETDAQGRFSFEPLSPGDYELQAERAGQHALARVHITEEDDEPHVTLNLGTPLFIEGTVRDDAGGPIAGARVSALSVDDLGLTLDATTEADGRFRLGPVMEGVYSFSAEAEGYEDISSQQETLVASRPPLDFVLSRAVLLEGLVTDASGQPLAEVVLTAVSLEPPLPSKKSARRHDVPEEAVVEHEEEERESYDTVSDAEGRFVFELPRPGRYAVEVGEGRYLFARVETPAPAKGVRLVLRTGAALEGTVVDARGQPLEGVTLTVELGAGEQRRELETEAGPEGRFSLGGLPPGTYVVRAALDTGGFAHRASRTVQVRGTETVDASLRMDTGGSVSGIVVDEQGRPMADAQVWGVAATDNAHVLVMDGDATMARTGPDGRFTVHHLQEGECQLRVQKPGYTLEAPPGAEDMGVSWGQPARTGARDVRLVLRYQGRITGRVTRADGTPIPRFSLNGEFIRDPKGRFSYTVEQAGEVGLLFEAPGLARKGLDVEVRTGQDVDVGDVRLDLGLQVRGRVVDARTGAPVVQAPVRLRNAKAPEDLGGHGTVAMTHTGADGTFTLDQLEPYPYQLEVEHEAYVLHRQPVEPGDARVEVRLQVGTTVEGTVRDRLGRPVPAQVRLVPLNTPVSHFHHLIQRAGTEAEAPDGRFSANRLEPGEYAVRARSAGGTSVFLPRRVSLPANGRVALDLEERTGTASLRVRIHRLNLPDRVFNLGFALVPGTVSGSAPPEELWALAHHLSLQQAPGSTSREPLFVDLPAGRYTLLLVSEVGTGRYESWREEVDVAEGAQLLREVDAVWRPVPGGR
jgi:protocatechuate 3,4-dioxygenase beta subunit